MTMGLYCKVYVDAEVDTTQLIQQVGTLCGGTTSGRTIESTELTVDVSRNEDHRPVRGEPASDFVYFPYYLDVTPGDEVARDVYIGAVRALLHGLQRRGATVVAACDFENELT